MAQEKFDPARFSSRYDRNERLDLARFQRTVEEFMVLLRSNELRFPNDQELLNEFCNFIDDREVWHLAQTSVPEFRFAKMDESLTGRDADATDASTALDYVLDKLTMLPPPRSDKNVLTSEQELMSQRHKQWVEYIVTGGTDRQAATPVQRAECDKRISQIDYSLRLAQSQDPIQLSSEMTIGKRRDGQELDDHSPNDKVKKGGANKVKKGGVEKCVKRGPMDNYTKVIGKGF